MDKWHTKDVEGVLSSLKAVETGLSKEEAKRRLRRYGPNRLGKIRKISPSRILFRQFASFLVLILVIAVLISVLIAHYVDAAVISSILILNAVLGFVQEYKAERTIEALEKLASPNADVLRGGRRSKIPAMELVPGDIIFLETGSKVPADCRLIEAFSLEVDESSLTGESVPVEKSVLTLKGRDLPIAERHNMVFSSTVVTRGRATAIVVDTGTRTEMGHIAKLVQEVKKPETPLQTKLNQAGRIIGGVVLGLVALMFFIGVQQGAELFDMFLVSVSLAVAAVPEGLPAVVTIALALGVGRMAKHKAIVRKLPVVETLGAATYICSDKTGTLTKNEMTVQEVFADKLYKVSGEGYTPKGEFISGKSLAEPSKEKHLKQLLMAAAICNNSILVKDNKWSVIGDPTEGALNVVAAKAGISKKDFDRSHPRVAEFAFTSERKRMSVVVEGKEGIYSYVKGAPELILRHCNRYYTSKGPESLGAEDKKVFLDESKKMAGKALRVIALAYKPLPTAKKYSITDAESNLVLIGLVGMMDPPRPEAIRAVSLAQKASINVVMITGDHRVTAEAIAGQMGILKAGGKVLTGEQLSKLSNKEFEKVVENVAVYARVDPEHKLRIIAALKRKGHVVAMTGDGVNDAPALKDADIGVAMGISGTDVAKEASDMILRDDDFATIVQAIKEGRAIYANIRKFLRFLLSSNLGEVFTIFGASLIGLPLPLLAVQILWMNLLTDGLPAVALSVDPASKEVMYERPRKPKDPPIDKPMIRNMLMVGLTMMAATLLVYWFALSGGMSVGHARTLAFSALVMTQLVRVFSAKTERSLFKGDVFNNRYLLGAVGVSLLLQLAVVYVPFLQSLFYTTALGIIDWVLVAGVSISVLVAVELEKFFIGRADKTSFATVA